MGREKHTGCSLLSPPDGQVLRRCLPRITLLGPYPAYTPGSAGPLGLGDGGGGGTCLFQTKPGKPLTSTTGTITQGPSSLKLRRADPSQGKCGHVLSLRTKADSAPGQVGAPSRRLWVEACEAVGASPKGACQQGRVSPCTATSPSHAAGALGCHEEELWPR